MHTTALVALAMLADAPLSAQRRVPKGLSGVPRSQLPVRSDRRPHGAVYDTHRSLLRNSDYDLLIMRQRRCAIVGCLDQHLDCGAHLGVGRDLEARNERVWISN